MFATSKKHLSMSTKTPRNKADTNQKAENERWNCEGTANQRNELK